MKIRSLFVLLNIWVLAAYATQTNTPPGFTVGQYVCNLTPATVDDIFYRQITSISDDVANQRLTLFTVDVPLTEIATNGSVSISSSSVILQSDTNGVFTKVLSLDGAITFPRIGYSLDGAEFTLKNSSALDVVKLTLEQEHWWLTPRLQTSVDISWGKLRRFEAIASGNTDQASIWDADVLLTGIGATNTLFELPPAAQPKVWMFLGSIGPVPVYASLGFDLKLVAEARAQANLSFRSGESQGRYPGPLISCKISFVCSKRRQIAGSEAKMMSPRTNKTSVTTKPTNSTL